MMGEINYLMKRLFKLLIITAMCLFILSINGPNVSSLFIVICILIAYSVVILKRISDKYNKRWLQKSYKIYRAIVVLFISSFFIVEGILTCKIIRYKDVKEIENLNYVLVLGAGLDGQNVGRVLANRLDKAIEYYELHRDTKIIVSGGLKEKAVISEADAMYKYLVKKGVNPEQIIKENSALTTFENIEFTNDILKSRHLENEKVLIITNEFHLTRSMLIADLLGMKNEGLSCYTPIRMRIHYMISEYISITRDFIKASAYKISN